jgi:hypothetical protein
MPGGIPQVISTPEIEYLLGETDDLTNSRVFSIVDQGRTIVCFSFGQYTLCYDVRSQEFHRRSVNSGRWPVLGQSGLGHFVSTDFGSDFSRVAKPDSDIGTEFGQLVEREIETSNFNSDGMTNRLTHVYVTGEMNYRNYTPQYSNPNLSLSVSNDYGYTYGIEMFDTFGGLGNYIKQMEFLRLGVFPDAFTLRMKTKNPYPHRINKVLAKIKKGRRQI